MSRNTPFRLFPDLSIVTGATNWLFVADVLGAAFRQRHDVIPYGRHGNPVGL
jgi:hypothetical protein